MVAAMRAEVEGALANVTVGDRRRDEPAQDGSAIALAFHRALDAALERLARQQVDPMVQRLSVGMIQRANQQNHTQTVEAILRAMGVDVGAFVLVSPAIRTAIDAAALENTALIRSIASQYLDKVRAAIGVAQVAGRRASDVAREIREIGGVTESRARLIARDQTAKLNASLTQARQTTLGIKRYRWSTSGDERVRESHRELNGQVFSWDAPPSVGHPGHDVQCRCVAIPIFEDDQ
ncbi:plasmid-related protein [plant metagenome]|uniref:Plasmid-related protein n=1 Tax=plant metagenome TaxID=1297885 RepID=A0A484QIC2_9ZZZZ